MKNRDGWSLFLDLCLHLKDRSRLNEVLDLILSMDEKDAVATRLEIIRELLVGDKPQRQIASDLEVSIAKITRGSNELKRVNENLKKFLIRYLK